MKISAISNITDENNNLRRNMFIRLSNAFMSNAEASNPIEKANMISKQRTQKLGIENLEEFTIFPKEYVNGKMVITA